MAADEVPLGTCYKNGRLVVKEEEVGSDSLIPSDKRTMEVLREIGNSIHPSIQLKVDYPSNLEDGKMPILDLEKYGSRRSMVYIEFYPNSFLRMFHLKQ